MTSLVNHAAPVAPSVPGQGGNDAREYATAMRIEARRSRDREHAQMSERTAQIIDGVLADLDYALELAETNARSARRAWLSVRHDPTRFPDERLAHHRSPDRIAD